jgi:hypothetical protein
VAALSPPSTDMIDLNASNSRGFTTVIKLADESRNSTATPNDSELLFSAEANSWYNVEFDLVVTGTATLAGVRAGLSLPAGAEAVIMSRTNTNTTLNNASNATAISSLIPPANMLASQIAHIICRVRTTTAGVVALNWGQNTTDAVNLTVVKAGSILVYNKLH